MATDRRAEVTWRGGLTDGEGTIDRVGSGILDGQPVSWAARAEDQQAGRTSPEELVAAAHASCFCMALSNVLAKGGNAPEQLSASATVTFVPGTGITASALDVEVRVPGIDEDAFRTAAEDARDNCPVSQALAGNVELSVTARLAR